MDKNKLLTLIRNNDIKEKKDLSYNLENSNLITFIIVKEIDNKIITVANNLLYFIKNLGYKVKIINELSNNDLINNNNNDIYIIIGNSRKDKKTPKKYIFYQIEEVSIQKNINYLNNATIIWEVSIKNYNNYKHIPLNKIYIMPICEYFIKRNLLSIIKPPKINIEYKLNNSKIYILSLPETPNRLEEFTKQEIYFNNKDLFEVYPAIKFNPSWKGCAFSYVNIMYNATMNNFKNITVCEDDCFLKNDFIEKYSIIKEFLEKVNEWDLFVGVIANLPKNTILTNMYKYKNLTFIEINKMNSTVFNIYNHSIYNKILKWPIDNNDFNTNTIDAYIHSSDNIIISVFPFEFSCINVDSTIWNKNLFNEYNQMFEKSNILINKLISEYLKTNQIINII